MNRMSLVLLYSFNCLILKYHILWSNSPIIIRTEPKFCFWDLCYVRAERELEESIRSSHSPDKDAVAQKR